MNAPTCEYGYPTECGAAATWICYPPKFPGTIHACDQHAPRMVEAVDAHRLSWAPEMPLDYHKAYVTALAWQSWFSRGDDSARAQNIRHAFQHECSRYEERRAQ